jgi:hypothetical protein
MPLQLRLEPEPGHAIFFSTRKNPTVVVGESVRISRWSSEEFKHVDLHDFDLFIGFGDDGKSVAARTKDNLPCRVKAVFLLRPLNDPENLAKATFGFPSSRDLAKICSATHFRGLIAGEIRAKVQGAVGDVSFADLLADYSAGKSVEESLRRSCKDQIEKHGFQLIDCAIPIEVLEPEAGAFTETLRSSWEDYQKRKAWAAESKLRVDADQRIAESELRAGVEKRELELKAQAQRNQDDAYLNQELARHERDEHLEKLVTKQKQFLLQQEQERAEVQVQMDKLNDAIQRRTIEYEEERRRYEGELARKRQEDERHGVYEAARLQQARDAELADLKRKTETQQQLDELEQTKVLDNLRHEQLKQEAERKHTLSKLEREEESRARAHKIAEEEHASTLVKIEADRAEQEQQVAAAKRVATESLGLTEARVVREKTLAGRAADITMQEALLKNLPDILAKSYAPGSKLADVKFMYVGNATAGDQGSRSSMNQVLESIMTAMSTLPVLKDVLGFIRDWDARPSDLGQPEQSRTVDSRSASRT